MTTTITLPTAELPEKDRDELARIQDAADDGRLKKLLVLAEYTLGDDTRLICSMVRWPEPLVRGR